MSTPPPLPVPELPVRAPRQLRYVTVPLRISSILYMIITGLGALLAAGLLFSGEAADMPFSFVAWLLVIAMSAALAWFIEKVIRNLRKGVYWSWIASLCLAGLYVPSGFILLGIIMLIGLLNPDVKAFCAEK